MSSLCNQAADFAVSVGGTRRTGGAFLPPVTPVQSPLQKEKESQEE